MLESQPSLEFPVNKVHEYKGKEKESHWTERKL